MTLLPSLTGKSQALPDWRSDKKLQDLLTRRDRLAERARVLADQIAAVRAEHDLAVEADRRHAAEALLGRTADAPRAAAASQAALDRLLAEQRDADQELPAYSAAIAILEAEAKAAVAKDLERQYRAIVRRLGAALDQASAIAEEAAVLFNHAGVQFDGTDGLPQWAGLPPLYWPDLALTGQVGKRGNPNPSQLERFHEQMRERGW